MSPAHLAGRPAPALVPLLRSCTEWCRAACRRRWPLTTARRCRCTCKGAQAYAQGLPASAWHAAARRAGLPSLHPVVKSSQPLALLRQQQQLHRDLAASRGLISQRHGLPRGDAAVSPDLRLCVYVKDSSCRVHALGGSQLASCRLPMPRPPPLTVALSWAPGMQAIACLDEIARVLHLMAWFSGLERLVLQHTVQLHQVEFVGHAFLQWAPDAASLAVLTDNFALHALKVWLITSQGQVVCHWAAQLTPQTMLWYVCPTCSPDSAAFAALAYCDELEPRTSRVCVAHRRGVHHVPVPAEVRSLKWAPEVEGNCRVLICHVSSRCVFIDCAPDTPVRAAVHRFDAPTEDLAAGLTHIAVTSYYFGLRLLRMQPGLQLVQVAQIPLSFGLEPGLNQYRPVLSFSPTGAHLAVAFQPRQLLPVYGAAQKLAIYASATGRLLVSEAIDRRCLTLIPLMGAQLPWGSCGRQLAGYEINVDLSKARLACTVFALKS